MKNIAEGYYPNGCYFEYPWPFWIIDNFLDDQIYNTLITLKDKGVYEVKDYSDGIRATNKTSLAIKQQIAIR